MAGPALRCAAPVFFGQYFTPGRLDALGVPVDELQSTACTRAGTASLRRRKLLTFTALQLCESSHARSSRANTTRVEEHEGASTAISNRRAFAATTAWKSDGSFSFEAVHQTCSEEHLVERLRPAGAGLLNTRTEHSLRYW